MNKPEMNRLIKLQCYDWSPYTIFGKWVPYKKAPPKKKVVGSRFMSRRADGTFENGMNHWSNGESWEYVDQPHASGSDEGGTR